MDFSLEFFFLKAKNENSYVFIGFLLVHICLVFCFVQTLEFFFALTELHILH